MFKQSTKNQEEIPGVWSLLFKQQINFSRLLWSSDVVLFKQLTKLFLKIFSNIIDINLIKRKLRTVATLLHKLIGESKC